MCRSSEGPARVRGLNPSAVSAAVRDAEASRLARQPARRAPDQAPDQPPTHGPDGPSLLPAVQVALWVRGGESPLTRYWAANAPNLKPHRMLTGGSGATVFEARKRRLAGSCPELVMLADHLTQVEAGRSGSRYSAAQAREDLRGSRLLLVHLREPGDPLHGEAHQPCGPCRPLLREFGIECLEDVPETFRAQLSLR